MVVMLMAILDLSYPAKRSSRVRKSAKIFSPRDQLEGACHIDEEYGHYDSNPAHTRHK